MSYSSNITGRVSRSEHINDSWKVYKGRISSVDGFKSLDLRRSVNSDCESLLEGRHEHVLLGGRDNNADGGVVECDESVLLWNLDVVGAIHEGLYVLLEIRRRQNHVLGVDLDDKNDLLEVVFSRVVGLHEVPVIALDVLTAVSVVLGIAETLEIMDGSSVLAGRVFAVQTSVAVDALAGSSEHDSSVDAPDEVTAESSLCSHDGYFVGGDGGLHGESVSGTLTRVLTVHDVLVLASGSTLHKRRVESNVIVVIVTGN